MKLTDLRKKTFIKTLRECGSPYAAAKAASPLAKGDAYETFRDEKNRNPHFAAEWASAEQDFMGRVEAEITKRAMEPARRPVFSKGELVGEFEDRHSADRMLLRLAAKLDPAWRERSVHHQQVEVRGAVLSISPSDVLLLPEAEQRTLLDLLQAIASAKGDPHPVNDQGVVREPMPGPTTQTSQTQEESNGLRQLPQGSQVTSGG